MQISSIFICILLFSIGNSSCDTIRNCSCVYFRLDDVQDWFLTFQQKTLLDLFESMKIPLTIGVIGSDWNTGDKGMLSAVSEALARSQNDNCFRMEVANHGWLHEHFTNLTMEEQILRMNLTQNVIKESLNVVPKTFIAPYNQVNETTFEAAIQVGFKYISAEVDLDRPPYQYDDNSTLFRFPVSGETGTDVGGYQIPVQSSVTWEKVQSQLQNYGFAGVMIHPYEFSNWNGTDYENTINQTTLNDLVHLLTLCRESGLKLVLISEIDSFFNISHPDPCPSLTTSQLTTSPLTTSPITTEALTTSKITTSSLSVASRFTTGEITTSRVAVAQTTGRITTSEITSGIYNNFQVEQSENGSRTHFSSMHLFVQFAIFVLLFIN